MLCKLSQELYLARFSEMAALLYAVTGKASFRWGEEQQQSFEALVERLTSPPVLAIPTTDGNFVLDTDASYELPRLWRHAFRV